LWANLEELCENSLSLGIYPVLKPTGRGAYRWSIRVGGVSQAAQVVENERHSMKAAGRRGEVMAAVSCRVPDFPTTTRLTTAESLQL